MKWGPNTNFFELIHLLKENSQLIQNLVLLVRSSGRKRKNFGSSSQLGPNHICVILYVRHVFDTLKSICEKFLLGTWQRDTFPQQCLILKIVFSLKNQSITSASRLCDTLNVMEVQVSSRRDSITQTWYFNILRKKQFSKLHIVEEMYE